ncbi:uncharacterized protein LOC113357601 [Papaver somniferum]|uniref:uncharacterized protein LOC113357601 n=1 Tax=Papaver somniferum TaxID=3469 RepID=UPI000E6FDF13|nr:uncharacterized protein LOC113357601 [Papaver somniferum]
MMMLGFMMKRTSPSWPCFEFKSKAKKDIEKTCADQSTEEGSSSESDSDWDGVPFVYDSDFLYDDFTNPFLDIYNEVDFSYDDFTNPFLDIYNEDSDDEFNPLEAAILAGLMGGSHLPSDRRRCRLTSSPVVQNFRCSTFCTFHFIHCRQACI